MLIDISTELSDHYELVKRVAETAADDANASEAGKATLLNATTTILKELAKIQQDLYNSSTIATLQAAIVEGLEEADQEFKDKVMEILERRLASL